MNYSRRGKPNAWFERKIMNQHNSISSFTNVTRSVRTGHTILNKFNKYDKNGNKYFICGGSIIGGDDVCGP